MMTVFAVFQLLNIFQYKLNKRIDSLKLSTWNILNSKQKDDSKEVIKTLENITKRRSSKFNLTMDMSSHTNIPVTNGEDTEAEEELNPQDIIKMKKVLVTLKVARFLASNFFKVLIIAFFIICVTLAHVSIHGIIEIISIPQLCTFENFPNANGISSLVTPIFFIFFVIVAVVFFVGDVIGFIRENGVDLKRFFITDDPYGFRIEMTIDLFGLIIFVFASIAPLVVSFGIQAVSLTDVRNARGEISGALIGVFLVFLEWVILFLLCGIPILLTVISMIKKLFEPKIFENEFEALINDKRGKEIFKIFATKEWSLENILFFEEVEKFKRMKNPKHMKNRALDLSMNYIEPGAPLEVNLSGPVRKTVQQRVNDIDSSKEDVRMMFEDAIKETKRNMRDTYARIVPTKEYENWKSVSRVKIDESFSNVC
jgi:hypothetical protein